MIAERTTTHPITDADVKKALGLRCAMCFHALAFCRALGRADEPNEWWLASNYTTEVLLAEADRRGIDLSDVETEIEHQPLLQSMKYQRARGLITEREFTDYAYAVKTGRRDI